jgi:hypothetical protein
MCISKVKTDKRKGEIKTKTTKENEKKQRKNIYTVYTGLSSSEIPF